MLLLLSIHLPCRPRLGGHLVLPPWGLGHAPAEGEGLEAVLAAAKQAADDAAGGAAAPGGEALEGGLVVGADLTKAQVGG